MLQRGFMGAFDIKPDRVALAPSVLTATSIGVDLQPRKNVLERLLSVICDVRPGEGLGALILTINLFTLLGAYYLLKTVRESLILAEGGAEVKAYSSAAQAIILLGVVPLYGWIATHLNRNRLLRWTTLFFASNLLIFYFAGQAGTRIGMARRRRRWPGSRGPPGTRAAVPVSSPCRQRPLAATVIPPSGRSGAGTRA